MRKVMARKHTKTVIRQAVKIVGLINLGKKLGVTYQTISNWMDRNKMPDKEYSGQTIYAAGIEHATDGKVTIMDILGTVPEHQAKELARLKKKHG